MADVVVRQAGCRAADKHQVKVEQGRLLTELRVLRTRDALIIALRENDRVRVIDVTMYVPNGRTFSPKSFDDQ